jgi:hypothetical protein
LDKNGKLMEETLRRLPPLPTSERALDSERLRDSPGGLSFAGYPAPPTMPDPASEHMAQASAALGAIGLRERMTTASRDGSQGEPYGSTTSQLGRPASSGGTN